jgi:hypothetical protein
MLLRLATVFSISPVAFAAREEAPHRNRQTTPNVGFAKAQSQRPRQAGAEDVRTTPLLLLVARKLEVI